MGEIPQEVYDKIDEKYPTPLNMLLNELVVANKALWLDDEHKRKKIGADEVREHGLTRNQRRWAEKIADSI